MDRISVAKYYTTNVNNEPVKSNPSRYISNGDLTSSSKASKMPTASPSPSSSKSQSTQQHQQLQASSKGSSSSQRTYSNSKYIQPNMETYLYKKPDNDENSHLERNKFAKSTRESKLIQKIDKLALESLEKREKLESDLKRLELSKERTAKERPFLLSTNNAAASTLESASKNKLKSKEKSVKYKPNDLNKLKYSYYMNNNYTTMKNRNQTNENRSVDRSQQLTNPSSNHEVTSRKLLDYYPTTRNNLDKKSTRLTTSGLTGSTYSRSTKFVPAPTPDKEAERYDEHKKPSGIGLQKTASKNESSEESELFKKIMAKLSELPDSVFLNPSNYSNFSSRNSLYDGSLPKKNADYLSLNNNYAANHVFSSHSNETNSVESTGRRSVLSHATHLPLKIAVEDSEPLEQVKHESIQPKREAVETKSALVDSTEKRNENQTREEKNSSHKTDEKEEKVKSTSEIKKTIIYIEPARTKTSKNPMIVSITNDRKKVNDTSTQLKASKKSGEEKPSESHELMSHDQPKHELTQEPQKIEIIDKTSKMEAKRTPDIENFAQFEHQMRNLITKKLEPDTIQSDSKPIKMEGKEPRPEKTSNKQESEKKTEVITFLKVVNVDQAQPSPSNSEPNQSNRIKIIRINNKDPKPDRIETIQFKTIKSPDSISSNEFKHQLNQHQQQQQQKSNESRKSEDTSDAKERHHVDNVPVGDNLSVKKVAYISINKKTREEPNEVDVSNTNKESKTTIVLNVKKDTSNKEVSNEVGTSHGQVESKVIETIEKKSNDEVEKSTEAQHNIHKMQLPPVRKISTPPPIPHIIHDPAVAASFIAAAAAAGTSSTASSKSKPSLARNDSNHLINDEVAAINGYNAFAKAIRNHQELMIDSLLGNKKHYNDSKPLTMRRHASNYTLPITSNVNEDSQQSSSIHGTKKTDWSSDFSNRLGNSKYRKGSVDTISSTTPISTEKRQYDTYSKGDKSKLIAYHKENGRHKMSNENEAKYSNGQGTKTSTPSNKHKDEYIEQPAKQNRESVYFDANGLLVGTKYSRNSALPEYSTKTSGNHTNNMMMMIPIKTYKESNNPKSFYENYAKENDKRRKEGSDFLMLLPGIAIPIDTDASDTDDDMNSSSTN